MGDMAQAQDLQSLRNIGPAMASALEGAGITSVSQLREMGADAAYAAVLATGHRPHFIAYYVLHMALQGRPWNDCKGAEKTALRATFDAIAARAYDPELGALERALDMIGVRRK